MGLNSSYILNMKNISCVLQNCLILDLLLLGSGSSTLTNSDVNLREPGFFSTGSISVPLAVSYTNAG